MKNIARILQTQSAGKYYRLAKVELESGQAVFADCPRIGIFEKVMVEVKLGIFLGNLLYQCQK